MKVIRLLLSVGVLFALTQCKKPEEKSGDQIKPMTELNVPSTFDWKMAHTVNFHITGSSGTDVKVTSTDGSVTFYKCRIKPGTTTVDIPLSIPDVVREVLVNGITVPLTGPNVQVTLPALKGILLDNYCLFFDLSDYLNLGDITELNNASAFTIEGWAVQPDVDLPATKTLFNKSALGFNDIRVYTNGGTLYIHLGNGSDSYAAYANYSTEILDNNWYHWAVVYDGTGVTNADRLKLYLNGNSTEKVLAFTGTIPAVTSSALDGEDAFLSYPWEPWAGYMDEVRIWSVARTGAEIATTYNKLIAGSTANLLACWRMDEATGTTAYDETSHNYDAYIHICT